MVSVNLILEKEGLEHKVWVDSFDGLWIPDSSRGKQTLILNMKDPAWKGEYNIKKVEMVLNYDEKAELPPFIQSGLVANMEVKIYLKRK